MSGTETPTPTGSEIAVIGLAGRFPGARNVAEFWRNLRDGVESIRTLSDEDLIRAGVPSSVLQDPNYVKSAAVLEGVDLFDAGFFGFNPKEAAIMDPQHRHFLECAWEALEHAGYAPASIEGSVGVYAGSGMHGYMMYNLVRNAELMDSVGLFLVRHTGNDKDFLTTRLSYLLNLKGPSINVQTACSTSLVGVHMACQSLLNGECDMAVAGGVTIELPHGHGYMYKDGEILSPDGHCRPFDADAKGTIFGSGTAIVVLKRLDQALEDGDFIHAVIRGSAINNDGSQKVGYLAPSVDGQAAAVSEAIAVSGVPADTITYVEAHGTGTAVGDPIEIAALTSAFRVDTDRTGFCSIGSVKSNIGHLDTAAGVAGLIKTIEALKHREIPPSLHFRSPNPVADFENSPFVVNAALREWPANGTPRRAGVNSLGVGGTNAHVIVEEAPAMAPSGPSRAWQLLMLSAKSEPALEAAADNLIEHLRAEPDQNLADIAWTLHAGREAFAHRRTVVCRDGEEAVAALEGTATHLVAAGVPSGGEPSPAFMFAGGGAQYPGMGAGLYESEEVYRSVVDECLELLESEIDFDLRSLLYPADGDRAAASARLEQPSAALPALFITQYAQARLWMSWGIQPDAMIGHSMGEYTAACLAGVFSLKDALALVALRGRLFEQVDAGGMLSVPLPPDDLLPQLGPELSLAAVNAPELSVASGPVDAIADLERRLRDQDIECRRIHIAVAAHSSMLEPILPPFAEYLRTISLSAPSMPMLSNVTGTWMTAEDATDPDYWVRHLRHTVRFAEGVERLLDHPDRLLLEVGPGRTLATLVRQHPAQTTKQVALNSIRHPDEPTPDAAFMLNVLGQLWTLGVPVRAAAFYEGQKRRRLPLPTYPFEHRPHWIESSDPAVVAPAAASENGNGRRDLPDWFYRPEWKHAELEPVDANAADAATALVFVDEAGFGDRLADALRVAGASVIRVQAGRRFESDAEGGSYTVDPASSSDMHALVRDLVTHGRVPDRIAFCWGVSDDGAPVNAADWTALRARYFTSLVSLAQAIGAEDVSTPMKLVVLTTGLQQVAGEDVPAPFKSLLLGPCRVIPQEFPTIRTRSVDFTMQAAGSWREQKLIERICDELAADTPDGTVAYRGQQRFVQMFGSAELQGATEAPRNLREGGTYLITGGLGGIALTIGADLARTVRANLILVGRRSLPPRERWDELVARNDDPQLSRTLRSLREIESLGGTVMVASADVRNAADMQRVVAAATARFGAIHGVIHSAGVLDDGLIQLKSDEAAERVLAPKVLGTLALDEAFRDHPLDFMVLFSSISAIAGLAGQVDYTAANAFLDAFAQHRHARTGQLTLAVNWSTWREVGMAAALAGSTAGDSTGEAAATPTANHPLLDSCLVEEDGTEIYATRFSTADQWLVAEHRLRDGDALIPGTGYLELARSALMAVPQNRGIVIDDVLFLAPFVVPDNEVRELQLWLRRNGSSGEFIVVSPSVEDESSGWYEHVRGRVGYADFPSIQVDVQALAGRCSAGEHVFIGDERNAHLDFGPRWHNLRRIRYGAGEALITLELPPAFEGDLEQYRLHPALLDMATAGAQNLIDGFQPDRHFYVPVGYSSLAFRGSLPTRLYSHVRLQSAAEGMAVYDVTLLDESGDVVAEISEFMMKRLDSAAVLDAPPAVTRPHFTAPARKSSAADSHALALLEDAIRPEEGVEVFRRLLNAAHATRIVVSPTDLTAWLASQRQSMLPAAQEPAAAPIDPRLLAELLQAETALLEHPAVARAAVTSRPDRTGDMRRVAYIVYDAAHHATVSELRRYVKSQLSPHLVPSAYIELDALPLLASGEVDQQSLPDPFGLEDTYVAPATPMQKVLAQIWQEVLGINRVGIHDNFFDIGGHSLLAMRVISKLDKKTGVRLDNAIMVLHTLEQIAAECDRRSGPQTAAEPDTRPAEADPGRERLSRRLFNAFRQNAS